MTKTTKGYVLGAIAAISYGTNPLFAVPLYRLGMSTSSVLFYRYFFAILILGCIMMVRKVSFKLERGQIGFMISLGIMFALSSLLLFEAYNHMDVGLASILLFVEPVFIALILWGFFHDKISRVTIISIGVCLAGIILLCNPGPGAFVTATGIILVISSSLTYAIYMVIINKSRIRHMPGTAITFYSLLFGLIVFVIQTNFLSELQPVPMTPISLACVTGISIVPTIISLLAVTVAVQYIGSVPVAILGALEPITGLMLGVCIFGEQLTFKASIGVFLILGAVILLVSSKDKQSGPEHGMKE